MLGTSVVRSPFANNFILVVIFVIGFTIRFAKKIEIHIAKSVRIKDEATIAKATNLIETVISLIGATIPKDQPSEPVTGAK